MRIAVCDDEAACREILCNAIHKSGVFPDDTEIVEFSEGTALLSSHKKKKFDVVFLDIEMPQMSGLETGKEIRFFDDMVTIVFISSHRQYVFSSFKVEPFDYIVKPVEEPVLKEMLQRVMRKYREQHHIIHFTWNNASYALEVNEIIYLESYHRLITFITKENIFKCIGKINDYEKQLSPYGFLRCHQGFLINMRYIKSIEDKEIITSTGISVQMSIRKKQDCLKIFSEYMVRCRI